MPEWSDEALERAVTMPEPPPDREVFIRIRAVHKRFGPRHILRGIDLDIYRGETVAILGLSGSGKSTLMKHLTGSLRLDTGSVSVGRYDLSAMSPAQWDAYRRDMGVVFQHAALLGSLSVEDNVGLPLLEVERLPRDVVRERVIQALRRVFLPAEEILHLSPASLSGGMQKRVGLARAIIREPALLFYDEPTTGLDPVTVSGVNEMTLELQRRLGVTSLVITHDLEAAFTIADRIAMLYKGRIIACDPGAAIRESDHPVLQQLLTGSTTGPLTEAFAR